MGEIKRESGHVSSRAVSLTCIFSTRHCAPRAAIDSVAPSAWFKAHGYQLVGAGEIMRVCSVGVDDLTLVCMER